MKQDSFAQVFFKKILKIKALQALGKISHIFQSQILKKQVCSKRAFLRLPVGGSVSIEAAVAIPVFLFCFLEIFSLLNYLSVYNGVLYTLKNVGDTVSVYGYAYDRVMSDQEEVSIGEKIISSVVFSEAYLDTQIRRQCQGEIYENTIKGGVKGIQTLGSHIDTKDNTLLLTAYYTVKPIVQLTESELRLNNKYYAKLWTGYEIRGERDEDIAYITPNASVYHLTEDCSHLKLSIKKVDYEDLMTVRNEEGSKYKECLFCAEEAVVQDFYYITSQGDKYHSSISCSGLKRTIYRVSLKEVKQLSLCKRCSQKEEGI